MVSKLRILWKQTVESTSASKLEAEQLHETTLEQERAEHQRQLADAAAAHQAALAAATEKHGKTAKALEAATRSAYETAEQHQAVKQAEEVGSESTMAKFMVLATCTIRAGPESDSEKVGDHQKGTIITVVQQTVNSDGLQVLQTITPGKGMQRGGWVKKMTRKGRLLLEQLDTKQPASRAAEMRIAAAAKQGSAPLPKLLKSTGAFPYNP